MIKKFEEKMQKSIESLEREYNSIRAGRANPHVLDKIKGRLLRNPYSITAGW